MSDLGLRGDRPIAKSCAPCFFTACLPLCHSRQMARKAAHEQSRADPQYALATVPQLNRTPPTDGLPRHRAIVAVDIEQSTSRPDPIKGELRRILYELFDQALRSAGIHRRHRDGFTDRGDGILALIRPVDQAAKPVLLNRAVPALSQLLTDYNSAARPDRQLRVRVVVHAGEVHYDRNGCFGEALDIAFRLLDAAHVKKALQAAADPLILVISGDIYRAMSATDTTASTSTPSTRSCRSASPVTAIPAGSTSPARPPPAR